MRRDLPGKGQKITDLEKGSDPYLASILDLTKDHLQDLKELRQMALSHLKKVYGAQEGKDSIRLEFHFPYARATATLHLHVRVNQTKYPLDEARSYSLDEVIRYLESGKTIQQLILDRQAKNGGLYVDRGLDGILNDIQGGSVRVVPNPFYDPTKTAP